jgi:hypothetical protein
LGAPKPFKLGPTIIKNDTPKIWPLDPKLLPIMDTLKAVVAYPLAKINKQQ